MVLAYGNGAQAGCQPQAPKWSSGTSVSFTFHYGSGMHSIHSKPVETMHFSIITLQDAENSKQLSGMGACEVMALVLADRIRDAQVVDSVCGAINNLAHKNK